MKIDENVANKFKNNIPRIRSLFFIVFLSTGFLISFFYHSSIKQSGYIFCPSKKITTIPCPGCGMGRSYFAFLDGEFFKAIYFHPLIPLLLLFLSYSMFLAIKDFRKNTSNLVIFFKTPFNKLSKIILFVVVIVVWIRNLLIY